MKTTDNMKLSIAISHTEDTYRSDYEGAVRYLKEKISGIFGAEHKVNRGRNGGRNVWEANQGGGRGRGRGSGRGRFGGRGGRGGRYGGRGGHHGRGSGRGNGNKWFNGVDCNTVDRGFSPQEWNNMGREGRDYVNDNRKRKNDGNGDHQSDNKRLIQQVVQEMSRKNEEVPEKTGSKSEKGGQNGPAFCRHNNGKKDSP